MLTLQEEEKSRQNYHYASPIDYALQHFAICLGIIIVVGFLTSKFFSVIFSGDHESNSEYVGYIGSIIALSFTFFMSMPCRMIIDTQFEKTVSEIERKIDKFLVGEKLSGFCFGYNVLRMDVKKTVYIPRYNPVIPRRFQVGGSGEGVLFNIFSVQTCLFLEDYGDQTLLIAPYRSLKILFLHLKR